MEHDSFIALFSVLGAGAFVIIAALLGGWFNRRDRDEDLYKEVGRLDGRTERSGTAPEARYGSVELYMMIGGLKTGVEALVEDVAEIKERQETNRGRQDKDISDLNLMMRGMHGDIEGIKVQFSDLRRSVGNLARNVSRSKKPVSGS